MAGFYLRGALIEFTDSFPLPTPNVIIFQFNPETMTHAWTPATTNPATSTPGATGAATNPLAVTGDPQETFSFTLAMDANDMIADGDAVETGLATASGVYTRLAALEMLLFPTKQLGGALVGSVTAALGAAGVSGRPTRKVPSAQLPTVLFVWGPGRIVPVRVTTLSITERLYDSALLNPIHAEAQISLRVLTAEELPFVSGPLGVLAKMASSYSQTLRHALALANLANAAESIVGMLPV
jgi:hypothetical protein